MQFVYPPSPTSNEQSGPPSPTQGAIPLSQRLRLLQAEVAALETELSDPTNPLLRKEKEAGNADPGELIRGMVDVKRRIEKISKAREGRSKLVSVVLGESDAEDAPAETKQESEKKPEPAKKPETSALRIPEVRDIVEMDKRVGELEKLVGSSSTSLDEVPVSSPCTQLLSTADNHPIAIASPSAVASPPHPSQCTVEPTNPTSSYRLHLPPHQAPQFRVRADL